MADLITVDEYKTYNNLSANPAQDGKIATTISAVSALIQAYIGRTLIDNYDDYITETFSVEYDTSILYPSHWPIRDIQSIEVIDPYYYDSTVHFPIESASYVLSDDTIVKVSNTSSPFLNWPIGPQSVVVTYRAGYAETPQDIKLAAIELVRFYLEKEYQVVRTMGQSSISNLTYGSASFPKHIQIILDRYK